MPLPKTPGNNETLRRSGWWARGGVTIAAPPPMVTTGRGGSRSYRDATGSREEAVRTAPGQEAVPEIDQQHGRADSDNISTQCHLFMGKYVDVNLTATGRDYRPALTVWHLRLVWNGTCYSPAADAPLAMFARDDDNGTPSLPNDLKLRGPRPSITFFSEEITQCAPPSMHRHAPLSGSTAKRSDNLRTC